MKYPNRYASNIRPLLGPNFTGLVYGLYPREILYSQRHTNTNNEASLYKIYTQKKSKGNSQVFTEYKSVWQIDVHDNSICIE